METLGIVVKTQKDKDAEAQGNMLEKNVLDVLIMFRVIIKNIYVFTALLGLMLFLLANNRYCADHFELGAADPGSGNCCAKVASTTTEWHGVCG